MLCAPPPKKRSIILSLKKKKLKFIILFSFRSVVQESTKNDDRSNVCSSMNTPVALASFRTLLRSVPFKPSHAIHSPSGVQTLPTRNAPKSFLLHWGLFLLLRGYKVSSAFSELTAAFTLFVYFILETAIGGGSDAKLPLLK